MDLTKRLSSAGALISVLFLGALSTVAHAETKTLTIGDELTHQPLHGFACREPKDVEKIVKAVFKEFPEKRAMELIEVPWGMQFPSGSSQDQQVVGSAAEQAKEHGFVVIHEEFQNRLPKTTDYLLEHCGTAEPRTKDGTFHLIQHMYTFAVGTHTCSIIKTSGNVYAPEYMCFIDVSVQPVTDPEKKEIVDFLLEMWKPEPVASKKKN
jgi:hypothetical protein